MGFGRIVIFPKKLYLKILIVLLALGFSLGVICFFFKQATYYTALPIKLTLSDDPYLDATIDGVIYPLELDLGSRLEASIYSDVLENLNKSSYGVEKWKNFQGTNFEYQTFLLPKIEIGSLTIKNLKVTEFPKERKDEYTIWRDSSRKIAPSETVGDLGRGVLEKMNLLLDVEGAKVIFTNSHRKLKDDGYHLAAFDKIPFKPGPKGIVIDVDTDLGRMKFLLDTGCTLTMVHDFLYPKDFKEETRRYSLPVLSSTHFTMNGTNFGNQDFYFINMTEELMDIDGILGMDFIKKHVIYINFSKSTLYIK